VAGLHVASGRRAGRARRVCGTVRAADVPRALVPGKHAEPRDRVPRHGPTRVRPEDVWPAARQRRPVGVQRVRVRLLRPAVQVNGIKDCNTF